MKDEKTLISIIVPVYRTEKYLDRCVESIVNQTYKNLEIILVDDGSPDDCPKMCDEFAEMHKNITVFHKENGGLGDARNYGVRKAKDDWIVFVDSDDYFEPSYVEDLVNLRNEYNADMVVTRTIREKEDGSGKAKGPDFKSFSVDKKEAIFQVYSGKNVGWNAYGKLYPKSTLLKYPFPDGYYEDCACMYKIINDVNSIAIGNYDSNYHYIQREGSILMSSLNEKHMHIFDICKEVEYFIEENYPDLRILVPLLYSRAIAQLLNLQHMPWEEYKSLFFEYRKYFRKNLSMILYSKRISKKIKAVFLILCMRPELFYFQRKIITTVRK